MKVALLLLSVGVLVDGCATVPEASLEDRTLRFGCEDVVLVGRLKNGDYAHVEIPDDIIGHGWITARFQVRKVVRASSPIPPIVSVRYFAHTYMREDIDFMVVAQKTEDSAYRITTAQRMAVRPRLARHCG